MLAPSKYTELNSVAFIIKREEQLFLSLEQNMSKRILRNFQIIKTSIISMKFIL